MNKSNKNLVSNNSSLVSKLAEVMAEVEWVEKKGRNNFFNYDYAKESDILAAIRNKLAEREIFIFTSVESIDFRENGKKTRDGATVNLVFVKTKHTFWDGQSGETMEVFGQGSGEDSGDKGVYKAITGAMKYFVSKNFLMSTGDDPEKDDEKEGRPNAKEISSRETPSFTPAGPFQPEPSPPAPAPSALNFENPARDFIKDIQSKTGPKKDGSTYTRFSIETRSNGFFTTFNPALADLAMEAKNADQEVLITYKANGRWKDIEGIRVVGAGVSPTLDEVNALPF